MKLYQIISSDLVVTASPACVERAIRKLRKMGFPTTGECDGAELLVRTTATQTQLEFLVGEVKEVRS